MTISDQRDGCGCLLLIAGLLLFWALSSRIGELRARVEKIEHENAAATGR